MSPVDPVLVRALGEPLLSASGREMQFACPFCQSLRESRSHKIPLHVNLSKGKWFCFRCEKGGNITSLYRRLGLSPAWGAEESRRLEDLFLLLAGLDGVTGADAEAALLPLPPLKALSPRAYAYLRSRGITDWAIARYRIYEGARIDGLDLRGRVVFPDEDQRGNLCYWVGRTFVGHRNKYRNAPVSRRDQVYQLARIAKRDVVVLVEGPVSAVVAAQTLGDRVIAAYGKHVTGRQIGRLVESCPQEVCVALDGDACGKAYAVAAALESRGVPASLLLFGPADDPASVSPAELCQVFVARRRYDPCEHLLHIAQGLSIRPPAAQAEGIRSVRAEEELCRDLAEVRVGVTAHTGRGL